MSSQFAQRCSSLILSLALLAPLPAWAQTLGQTSSFVSQIDEALTIRKVTILPVTDNLEGIYARPIEQELITLIKGNHQWDFIESNIAGTPSTLADLEEDESLIKNLLAGSEADAVIGATASKGPGGVSIRLDLFLKNDGRLLAQEVLRDHPRFEISDLREQVQILFRKIVKRIPYQGMVLSRQQNRVTVNLGKSDGIVKDQVLTVVQILQVNRHPKFHFLVSSEKEILGKIKVLKVDDKLSFGVMVSEKDKGVVKKFAKIAGLDEVTYGVPDDLGTGFAGDNVSSRPDAETSFGKNPNEWVPMKPPTFGQAGLKLGFGQYTSSVNVGSSGTFETKAPWYPTISLFGEIWMNPNWLVRVDLAQGVLNTPNPRSGSTPGTLNQAMSKYSLALGYNFLLRNDFFGPKLQARFGIMSYRMFVDDSQPTALTTVNYSGYILGLTGSLPVDEKKVWYVGALINMVLFSKLSEEPVSSGGSSQNTINDFSLFGEKKISENLRAIGSLDFSLFSTSFSGQGSRTGANSTPESATSLSQRHMVLSGGIAYLF